MEPFTSSELWRLDQYYMSPPARIATASPDDLEQNTAVDDFEEEEGVSMKRKSDGCWNEESIGFIKGGIASSSFASQDDIVASSPAKRKTVSLSTPISNGFAKSAFSSSSASSATSTPRPISGLLNPSNLLSSSYSAVASVTSPSPAAPYGRYSASTPTTPADHREDEVDDSFLSSSAPKRNSITILSSSPLKRASNSNTLARIACYPRVQVLKGYQYIYTSVLPYFTGSFVVREGRYF
jgi:hypothetical protein